MRLRSALQVVYVSLMLLAGATPAWSATRHVVLLYDERPELPGLAILEADLIRTLTANSSDRIEIYREEMDRSRFGTGNLETALRDFMLAKYSGKKIDVAVAVIGPALDFLLKHGDAIFPGTPIVFCGIDRREFSDRVLPPGIRGVLVNREFEPTLALALTLHPRTRNVFVVSGTSGFDMRLLEQARAAFRPYHDRYAFTYLTNLPMAGLLTQVSQLPPASIVLFVTFFQDGTGEAFIPHQVVQRVSAAANAPVYGFIDQYLGRGIVGGNLYSLAAHGTETGKLIAQVLADPQASGPAFLDAPTNKVIFDWRQMQRWNISDASLPAESEILFRELTAWQLYRWPLTAIGAAILLQAGLIGWLLHERQYRHRAEIAERKTMGELMQMNRLAGGGELSASIAHEVNQPLAAIALEAEAALVTLKDTAPDMEPLRSALRHIAGESLRAGDIIRNLRAMFRKDPRDRRPVDVNDIVRSVLAVVRVELERHGIQARTEFGSRLPPVNGIDVQLQQVVLNLILNAIEAMRSFPAESRALQVTTKLSESGDVRISVEDSGSGISPSDLDHVFKPMFTTKDLGMGMGLSICRTIVEAHGGKIWVTPAAHRGSVFQFRLPPAAH